jgi:hypothetical protein
MKIKTPTEIAKPGSEAALQRAVFSFCSYAMIHGFDAAWKFDDTGYARSKNIGADLKVPELRWIHSIPNGASFGGSKESRMKQGAFMKMEGLRPGVSDICWPIPRGTYHGLYLEMKTPTGSVRPDQREFMKFVGEQGYRVEIRKGWKTACQLIEEYYSSGAFR